ncbi:MAG: hypothetical protein FH758_10155 [Firmicutes bacterium]|nr:hypothetical protein [Bacillota bacterium]
MKRILGLLLAMLLLLAFVGCSETAPKSEEEARLKQEKSEEDEHLATEKQTDTDSKTESKDETTAFNTGSDNTVKASDLKVGDVIDGLTISKLYYVEGDGLAIKFNGEYTVQGSLYYDTEYYGDIVLNVGEESAIPTAVTFKFDDEYTINPPTGTFLVRGKLLDRLQQLIGENIIAQVKNGAVFNVEVAIDSYAFYAEKYTESVWECDITEVVGYWEETPASSDNSQPDDSSDTLIEFDGTVKGSNYFKFKADREVNFDLDNDGTKEIIKYDTVNGKLLVDGYNPISIPMESAEKEHFIIIKYVDKYDLQMYMIGVLDYGPSSDPATTLFSIIEPMGTKELVSAGIVPGIIVPPADYNENNIIDFNEKAVLKEGQGINAPVRLSIGTQTWFGRSDFIYYSTHKSLVDSCEIYDMDYITKSELTVLKNVKAYTEKDSNSQSVTIKPGQKVMLSLTDNKEWIYMKAEDNTDGWVNDKDVTFENFSGFTMYD